MKWARAASAGCGLWVGRDVTRAENTVREFWRLMASNDFASVKRVLADGFVLEWPQSAERIRGAENFARMNAEYPAHGPWRFELRRLVAGGAGAAQANGQIQQVVTHVGITDGTQRAEAISFFEVDAARGLIVRIVEFWPEPYAAPSHRAHLTEPIAQTPKEDPA